MNAVTWPSRFGERSEMTRKECLAGIVVAGLATVLIPVSGWTAECPVDQIISDTRAHHARSGKPQSEEFYQNMATNYRHQCDVARKNLEDWRPKRDEVRAGKRDQRDSYVILQTIWNNYEVLRTTDSLDAAEVKRDLDAILSKKPHLADLGPNEFRLSESINAGKARETAVRQRRERARQWKPEDREPKGFHAFGNQIAVQYQFRIEFFEAPSYLEFFEDSDSSWKKRDKRTGAVSPVEVPQQNPRKVLTFKNSFEVLPREWRTNPGPRVLVCTQYRSFFAPTTKGERDMVQALGEGSALPWKNEQGDKDQFCGIVDLAGNVVFEFPDAHNPPARILKPLAMLDSGKRAAVLVGREIREPGVDTSEVRGAGQFYELLIWTYPNQFRKVQLKEKNLGRHALYQRFVENKL